MDLRVFASLLCLAACAYAQREGNGNGSPGCADRLDVAFVVDSSGSIQEQDPNGWKAVKDFIIQIIRQFRIGPEFTRIGLTVYSEKASRQLDDPQISVGSVGFFNLNTYTTMADLEKAVNNLYYFNSLTNTQEGLRVANYDILTPAGGDRSMVPNLVIVITDGESNVGLDRLIPEAEALKKKATVAAVGVTRNVNINELNQIATSPGLVVLASNFQGLKDALTKIVSSACGAVPPMGEDTGKCCDFDGEYGGTYCDLELGGTARFTLHSGPTPSEGTGPAQAESGQNYAYLEASNLDEGDTAQLTWKGIGINGTCLTFYYNMYGDNTGKLFVECRETAQDDWEQVTNITAPTGEAWVQAIVELDFLVGDLRLRAVRGNGYQGDIAIDTLRLSLGSCFPPELVKDNNTDSNNTCTPPAPAPAPAVPPSGSAVPPAWPTLPPGGLPPFLVYPFYPPPPPPAPAPAPAPKEDLTKSPKCAVSESLKAIVVGGPNSTAGRVEIYFNKTFGTVCNSTFTDFEAAAVCKAAGFYGGRVWRNVPRELRLDVNNPKPVHLDNVRCSANANLADCCRGQWGVVSCNHSTDAYVLCDIKPQWCTPAAPGSPPVTPPANADLTLCDKNPPAFTPVLVDGPKPNWGRLEILYNGQFGTVCNDTFGVMEAMAVCKSLGYYGGNLWYNPPAEMRLAAGTEKKVTLTGVRCKPNVSLNDCCTNAPGFASNCTHQSDVFVRCYDRPEFCTSGGLSGCATKQVLQRPPPKADDDKGNSDTKGQQCGPNDVYCRASLQQQVQPPYVPLVIPFYPPQGAMFQLPFQNVQWPVVPVPNPGGGQ